MTDFANKTLHYIMDLEYTLSRVCELLNAQIDDTTLKIPYSIILSSLSELPDEFSSDSVSNLRDFIYREMEKSK